MGTDFPPCPNPLPHPTISAPRALRTLVCPDSHFLEPSVSWKCVCTYLEVSNRGCRQPMSFTCTWKSGWLWILQPGAPRAGAQWSPSSGRSPPLGGRLAPLPP